MRNKKTGKIQTCDMVVITDEQMDGEIASLNKHTFIFRSVEQFNDEYEAYKPTEPLIKDEKIRKAVRAWAEACDIKDCKYDGDGYFVTKWNRISLDGSRINIGSGHYTIAELCGEEEE